MNDIHPSARVSPLCDIEQSLRGNRVVVGAGSMIDSFVKIKFAGGTGDVVLGARTFINSGCVLYSGNGIRIGDHVSVAANVVFAPVNHAFQRKETLIQEQGFQASKGGIVVEDDAWIGAGCVLLDGAVVGRGCVVGAMSLVRSALADYGIYAGNPIQLLGWRQ